MKNLKYVESRHSFVAETEEGTLNVAEGRFEDCLADSAQAYFLEQHPECVDLIEDQKIYEKDWEEAMQESENDLDDVDFWLERLGDGVWLS